jgi:hypothetical protein
MTPTEHIEQNFVMEVNERDIILVNKKLFGDDDEHEYHCKCYNGIAYGTAVGWHDPAKNNIILSYPTVGQLCQYPAKLKAIREYCGLPSDEKITFGDIAIKYGKMGKWFIDEHTLNTIELLTNQSKMDAWLYVTEEGNFKDLENGGKDLSPKRAMHDLIDGLTADDFDSITNEAKFRFVKFLGRILK